MLSFDVNWWAVLVAGLINMVVGALWYSPALFAKPWMKLIGKSEKELAGGANTGYVITMIAALLQAFVLANVIHMFGADDIWEGATLGAAVWVAFAGATSISQSIFSHEPLKLWAINTGYYLTVLIINGALLAVWHY